LSCCSVTLLLEMSSRVGPSGMDCGPPVFSQWSAYGTSDLLHYSYDFGFSWHVAIVSHLSGSVGSLI
jgi:hypothetical protein